jgi:hypothetical protein
LFASLPRKAAKIEALMPQAILLAKQVKAKAPRVKYRNIRITDTGVRGSWQSAGPEM